jgi:four helix bundle protein
MRRKGTRKKEEGAKGLRTKAGHLPKVSYLPPAGTVTPIVQEGAELQDLRSRTKACALRVIKLFRALPRNEETRVLGRQLLRSGTAVGANYREARRARSDAEFVAKMGDCLKELYESDYWLELLADAKVMPSNRFSEIIAETRELMAIFFTIIRSKSG